MPLISTEEIERIKMNNDIVETISRYIPLVPKGKNFFGVCPFHEDHSPSMSVSKEKQIYTCFSCGATGNVIKFIEDYENVSFMEALKILADQAGIVLSAVPTQKNQSMKATPLYEIYELSSKFYQNNINTSFGKQAKEYLKTRNIDDQIIKEFGIGLALKKRDVLTQLLLNKKYDLKVLQKSGLVSQNEQGYFDSYYNRIMFPLWDVTGKVVGFSGRIFNGEKDSPKYVNSKESEIFKKGELLYYYHRAKEEARKAGSVIVMEGFMDVIRAYTIGVKNVIAMMGTAVTKEQAMLIKRMAKEVILCFDGDEAGAKATYSCSEELLKFGVTPKVVRLEDNLDPDEYITQHGKEKFMRKLESPMNLMDFKLTYLKKQKDLTSGQDVAQYVNNILVELTKIDDEVLRELTLKKISEESKLDIEFLKSQLASKTTVAKPVISKKSPIKKLNKYDKAQMYLLYYMLQSKEVIRLYNKKITFMPNEQYRNLAFHISYYYKLNGDISISALIDQIEDPELLKTLGEIDRLNLKQEYTKEEIEDYLATIKEYNLKNGQAQLQKQLSEEQDPKEKIRIANEILALKVRRENHDQ